jgi:LacI family transcriptional regulator
VSVKTVSRVVNDRQHPRRAQSGRALLAHGHRRIAFVGHDAGIFTTTERLRGYRETLAEAGIAADDSLTVLGAHNAEAAEAAVDALLALPDPPTAVVAANNRITVGVLRMLGRSGFDLARRLAGDDRPPQRVVLPTTLIARGSGEVRP